MPIYEFACEKHGVFEMIFPISRSDITEIVCDKRYRKGNRIFKCSRLAQRIVSLTSMHPDKYWSGQVVHGKYVTKKSQISSDIEPVNKNTRDYVRKRYIEHVKERKDKHDKDLRNFLEGELRQYDIGPDGYTVKQRRKYENGYHF